jgi:hypothetical protein
VFLAATFSECEQCGEIAWKIISIVCARTEQAYMLKEHESVIATADQCAEGHHWVVFSTALGEGWLMLQCVDCGQHGTVNAPTKKEWERAFHAPSRPYRWVDESRVHVRDALGSRPYVMRTVAGKKCECFSRRGVTEPKDYERVPAEIIRSDLLITPADREELVELARFVKGTDLCSRLFPLFIQSYQQDTGNVFPDVVHRVARRIEQIDAKGLHFSAPVVARVLWEYADQATLDQG